MENDKNVEVETTVVADAAKVATPETAVNERSGAPAQRGRGRRDGRRGRGGRDNRDRDQKEYTEKLVKLNRVAKVLKGGRRFSFSALVVVGDEKGRVGYGFGKANDVSEAIRKSVTKAKANMISVPLKNATLPHDIIGEYKSAKVLLKPAAPGTGVVAGGAVRAVVEAAGVTDIISKSFGSRNEINMIKAVFNGLERLQTAGEVAAARGKDLKDIWG